MPISPASTCRYDRAAAIYRKILELSPNNYGVRVQLVTVFSYQGMYQEALAQVSQIRTQAASAFPSWLLAYIYGRAGQRNEALKLLRELETRAASERLPPLTFARVYIGLGDKEKAFVWLRKGFDEQSDHLLHIGVDPIYDPLRSDPRFAELLRGIGLAR